MKRHIKTFCLLAIVAILSACEIDDGDNRPIEYAPTFGTASVRVINTIGFTPVEGLDIYVDRDVILPADTSVRAHSVGYQSHEFPQGSIVLVVSAGKYPTYNGTTKQSQDPIGNWLPDTHNAPLNGQFKDGGFYTVVATGDYDVQTHGITFEDDMTAPASGNARVRIIQALDDLTSGDNATTLGMMNLVESAGGASIVGFTSAQFGEAADYIEVTAGDYSWDVILDLPRFPALFTVNTITGNFEAGKIYTVVLGGSIFEDDLNIAVVEQ